MKQNVTVMTIFVMFWNQAFPLGSKTKQTILSTIRIRFISYKNYINFSDCQCNKIVNLIDLLINTNNDNVNS